MLLHYLKIAIRNLLKNKTQSAISIVGLAIGFACITLSTIWIRYEMTYDAADPNASNIYRVLNASKTQPGNCSPNLTKPFIDKLARTYPDIQATATIGNICYANLQTNTGKPIACYGTEPSFFDVFSLEFITGDKKSALSQPYSVVLSERTAKELFGSPEQAMGELIEAKAKSTEGDLKTAYKVTAVIKDVQPTNLKLDALIPFSPIEYKYATEPIFDNVYDNIFACYILLKENVNKPDFFNKLEKEENDFYVLKAVPITQLHYKYNYGQARIIPFNFNYIIILVSISFLLFICALFNHISLFISFTFTRLKNIGLRKAIGATMPQLFLLLLTEFLVALLISFLAGMCLIEVLRPILENATQITVSTTLMLKIAALFAVSEVVLSTLLISYPIMRICKIAIKQSITGKRAMRQQHTQKILVTTQLVISAFFVLITSVMYYQTSFVQTKDLGINIKNVISINPGNNDSEIFESKIDAITLDLQQNKNIQGIIWQSTDFFLENGNRAMLSKLLSWEGKNQNDEYTLTRLYVNYDFANFFDVKISEGRFFSKEFADADKIIVNQKLAKIIGNPVGKTITIGNESFEIIGVTEDIQDRSLKHELQPTILFPSAKSSSICIRYNPTNLTDVLSHIDNVLRKYGVSSYTVQFMEDTFKNFTKADTLMMRFVGIVSVVCLFISIFGIYSLTLYSMERRRREVAIRKVMGADVGEIIRMFFKEYLWLVVIACVIALPFAYYLMDKWLLNYANRISIRWWLIAGVVVILTSIVILTVLRQIIKAANSNPADVIKYE